MASRKAFPICCAALLISAPLAGQTGSPPTPFVSQPVALAPATGKLHGTLLGPRGGPAVPVVFIHPGSGPTDRDGNTPLVQGKNNSLRLLAEGFAARGIASLRVDKRGVAASAAAASDEADLRLETYVVDAVAWLRLLGADRRFHRVVVLGHSEGALIGALAAARTEVDGFISLAGPGRRGSDILREQLGRQLPSSLGRENERILSALERGERVDSVPKELRALYRPSVQPYIISCFRYEPASELQRLTIPVLIAQGTTDLQVDTTQAAVLRAARPDAGYLRVEGMNHILKLVRGGQLQQAASYGDSTLPLAPALLEGLVPFVHAGPATRPDGTAR